MKPLRLGSKTFFLSVILTAWPGAKMSSEGNLYVSFKSALKFRVEEWNMKS